MAALAQAACAPDRVDLRWADGRESFAVELADSPDERARGLMFRPQLDPGSGMLFVYESPRRAQFWMKNTLIPLDMIFADGTGRVTQVHSNAVPGDLTPIDGGPGVVFVLEINGGLARTSGHRPGCRSAPPRRAVGQRRLALRRLRLFNPLVSLYGVLRRGVAQPGSATVLGTVGREFESLRPDHFHQTTFLHGLVPCPSDPHMMR